MGAPPKKRRVLLVDDEVVFTRVLKSYLDRDGRYEVRVENSGKQGVITAKVFHPELILLDVIMPDLDGHGVAEELAKDPSTKRIPIVFLTAVVSREEALAREGVIAGRLFIAKPVSAKEVVACLERYLGNEGTPAGACSSPSRV